MLTGKKYLGHLSDHDPLYHYLRSEIQPQAEVNPTPARFRVFQLQGSNDVYLYEEKYSGNKVVGKFFLSERKKDSARAARRLEREFFNLCRLRQYGFSSLPHYVVRPLNYNHLINHLLVVEYCQGELLSPIIFAALYHGAGERLYRKLTSLAYFLATLHNRTATDDGVNFNEDCFYLDRLTGMLLNMQTISHDEAMELYWLRDQWRSQTRMWEDRQVLVHGDATPDNFLFGSGLDVIAFDLERSKHADRVFDVGRIAGELKHFFLQATGNQYAAEPYIGHFLWEYACHFPDRMRAFHSITGRIPFHIGLTLLRIARNSWIGREYRRQLIAEAKNNLWRYA